MRLAQSDKYTAMRSELRDAEIALMEQRERVAELRRRLSLDTVVSDYALWQGPPDLAADEPVRELKLSEVFTAPGRTLVLYHFMFGKAQTEPCPMCTMWADGYNAVAPHLAQRIDFGLVAAADVKRFRTYARSRGWTNLRLLSAGDSALKSDLGSEDEGGGQWPAVSVFRLGDGGTVRHFYTGYAQMTDEKWRGIDLLSPVWHFLDLTPEGRGDWFPSVRYE